MLTLTTVLAALIGAALACLGFLTAAVAHRIRMWRMMRPQAVTQAVTSSTPPRTRRAAQPPRRPQANVQPPRRAPQPQPARRDDVADWLKNMGYDSAVAEFAARRANAAMPNASTEDRIRAALAHCPEEN